MSSHSVVEAIREECAKVLAKLDELIEAVRVQDDGKKDGKDK